MGSTRKILTPEYEAEPVARYLRAVNETTLLPELAEVLCRRYTDLRHLAPALSLQVIADSVPATGDGC